MIREGQRVKDREESNDDEGEEKPVFAFFFQFPLNNSNGWLALHQNKDSTLDTQGEMLFKL